MISEESIQAACDWIAVLLQCEPNESAPLSACMETGQDHSDVRIRDTEGNVHPVGTSLCAEAYLIAMRRAIEAGKIRPLFETEAQKDLWQSWITADPCSNAAGVLEIPLQGVVDAVEATVEESLYQRVRSCLLRLLSTEKKVRYSFFYSAEPESDRRLIENCKLDEYGDDVGEAYHTMDDVAFDLQKKGIVRLTDLPETLMDGHPDYLIELVTKE